MATRIGGFKGVIMYRLVVVFIAGMMVVYAASAEEVDTPRIDLLSIYLVRTRDYPAARTITLSASVVLTPSSVSPAIASASANTLSNSFGATRNMAVVLAEGNAWQLLSRSGSAVISPALRLQTPAGRIDIRPRKQNLIQLRKDF